MVVGIYGGSFNPVHFGHIGLAHWVLGHTCIDSLWFMVTPNNPLKDSAVLADGRLRLEEARKAVALSLAEHPLPQGKSLQVSDFEFSLPLPSYTAQTLRALVQAFPQHEFVLVIGEDNWRIFTRWRDWRYILSSFPVFVYPRRSSASQPAVSSPDNVVDASSAAGITLHTGSGLTASPAAAITLPPDMQGTDARVVFLSGAPFFDISSTELRAASYPRSPLAVPSQYPHTQGCLGMENS
ncbi:MAG: nicotinate-nicotinamide nucleotide adenylyltransferase [Paludibacteraceae bacterium]|nr:nicotinate-nicotinamide nucleotide adenylyltransferase [Paludibacteraceae bacterium]